MRWSRPHPLTFWGRAFAIASLVHLTLPDFDQPGWWAPRIIEGVGALWLLVHPSRLAFATCALGTAIPLLFLRDVLTQSTLLTLWATVAAVGRRPEAILTAVRWTTAATYGLAVLHKLNTAFFDPAYSCATHAWAQVEARYGLWAIPELALPYLAVGVEVLLTVLVLRRSRWLWAVGVAFHVPLTVTLAPAFGPVMLAGYAATLTPRQLASWRRAWRGQRRWVFAVAAVAGALEMTAGGELIKALKVAALVGLAAWSLLAWAAPRAGRSGGALPTAALGIWLANGITPYLGLQYQHTAAMLSNLRIDAGCHNSLVVPESLRLMDPYIRIDRAAIGAGQRPAREATLRETLWSPPALHSMHRNWCIPENRPIALSGTWRGRAFAIPDLCEPDWARALPGAATMPGFQRYQKNLLRHCPTACVH